uniref:Putative retrotransposon protein n=1 Tax=Tanacetum cinerariifolium TaxID=118510 RepID=A0A6L2JEG9_TANCI|nr:putative retrotransposon protein [Tanacetum cinerariifolium]
MIISELPSCIAITPVLSTKEPKDSLIMGDEHLDTIFEKESDEFIKSSIKNLVLRPRIDEADCNPEEDIHLVERLLYDNSSPRPPEEINSKNSNALIESFSPSPIPVEDSDSLMEEIDLSLTLDNSMPSGIENDDYNSEGDILFLEELLSNDSPSLSENESFHFDVPLSPRPLMKPPDDEIYFEPVRGVLTTKVVDIRGIRILIAIAAFYDYEIWQMNVKTAFLNEYLSEEVYMEQPEGFDNPKYPNRNITSRFQQNPGDLYWTVVKNILKYLRNTKDMFLVYGGDIKRELRVSFYTNAGYLTDVDDLKSQTGYVFILNGGVVNWKSAKQSIFATSSAEAEYIATYDAFKEAVWVRNSFQGLVLFPQLKNL